MKPIHLSFLLLSLTQSIMGIELNSLTDAQQMVPDQTFVYKTVGGKDLHLYGFYPQQPEQTPSPTLLAIHGGGWENGEPRQFFPHSRYFALRGIPVFSVEYRLTDKTIGTTILDCVSDCNDAVAYIRSHAIELGIDPDRIAVIGDSSGGHLAACTGTLPAPTNRANAVINCNGIMDLTGYWISKVPNRDAVVAASISPQFNISSNTAPMIHIHSLVDTTVTNLHALNMHTALTNAGVHSELHWLQDAEHAFILPGYRASQEQIVEGLVAADRFLESQGYLFGDPTISVSTILSATPINAPAKLILETNTVSSLPLELEIGTAPSVSIEMEVRLNSKTGTLIKRESHLGFIKRGFALYFKSNELRMTAIRNTVTLASTPTTGSWETLELTIGFSNAVLQIDGTPVPLNAVEFAYPQEGRFLSIGDGLDGEIRNVRITTPFLQTTNAIPFAWLEDHGLTTDATDPDSDGFQTLEEYIAATNPTNGLDYLHLGLNTNGLAFTTTSNRNYEIISSDNLTSNHWNSVTNLPGTGTLETLPFSTNRFYQLKVSMP